MDEVSGQQIELRNFRRTASWNSSELCIEALVAVVVVVVVGKDVELLGPLRGRELLLLWGSPSSITFQTFKIKDEEVGRGTKKLAMELKF